MLIKNICIVVKEAFTGKIKISSCKNDDRLIYNVILFFVIHDLPNSKICVATLKKINKKKKKKKKNGR